jgi:hypothetical protein
MAKNSVKLKMSFDKALLGFRKKKESKVVSRASNKECYSGTYIQCVNWIHSRRFTRYNILPIPHHK